MVENGGDLMSGIFLLNHKGLLNDVAVAGSLDSSWNNILKLWYFLGDFCDEWLVDCIFDDCCISCGGNCLPSDLADFFCCTAFLSSWSCALLHLICAQ